MQAATTPALRAPGTERAAAASRPARILRGISPRAILAFAIMIASEAPVLFLRALLIEAAFDIFSAFNGQAMPLQPGWVAIASFAWAAIAMILPAGDGWAFRLARGARVPGRHEQARYRQALELLAEHAERPLTLPASWFITDRTPAQIALYGETLTIGRSLLSSGFLPELLAREIARIETGQGRLTAARAKLTLKLPGSPDAKSDRSHGTRPRRGAIAKALTSILSYARGGYGIDLTEPIWRPLTNGIERDIDERAKQLTGCAEAGETQAA